MVYFICWNLVETFLVERPTEWEGLTSLINFLGKKTATGFLQILTISVETEV